MKKLLDADFNVSGKKKGSKQITTVQQQSSELADALEVSFESMMATPREDKPIWLSTAIRTLKEERKSLQDSSLIHPEASVSPEEDDGGMEFDSQLRGPEPSIRLPTTQYHKNIKFQPYKSTRPDLLVKLERFIHQHLHENPIQDFQRREGAESPELLEVKLKHSSPKSKSTKKDVPLATFVSKSLTQSISSIDNKNPWRHHTGASVHYQTADDGDHHHPANDLEHCANRKQIYAEALQEYINDCTIYKPILQEAKNVYEHYIELLENRIDELAGQASQVNTREEQLEKQIEDNRIEQQQKVDAIQEQCRGYQQRIQALEKEKRQMDAELNRQRDAAAQVKKEFEVMRNSCVTLTSSLARMDEEHRTYQNSEASRLSEINHLRSAEQKLNEEIERLQQVIQNMEQAQSNMVNQEVVINLEMTMDTLKAEVKRMEATHRQLLIRYATMKNILDESFKTWQVGFLAAGGSTIVGQDGNSAFYDERTRQQVQDVIHSAMSIQKEQMVQQQKGHRKKPNKGTPHQQQRKDIAQQHPMEKLMFMIEKGANVKIVLETLVDHLAISTGGNLAGSSNNNGPGGVVMRNGGSQGAIVAYLGNLTAGNGPYLDQYEATSFDMMNNSLAPGNTGNRTYTFDNNKGEEIFITNPTLDTNNNNNAAGGGIASFAEEFKSPWHHFEGLGFGEHVPVFLRFHGKIQNLFFSKLEIIRILSDVWHAKTQYDAYLHQFGNDYETAVTQAVAYISDNNILNSTLVNDEPIQPMNTNIQNLSRSNVNTAMAASNPRKNNNQLTATSNTGTSTPLGAAGGHHSNSTAALAVVAHQSAPNASLQPVPPVNNMGSPVSRVGSAAGNTRVGTANTIRNHPINSNNTNAPMTMSVPALPFYANLPLHLSMATFLHQYFLDKYRHPAIAMEMGYNVVDAVKRFQHVSDCRLFAAVLEDRLPMEAWEDQRDMLEKVRDEVRKEIKMLQSNSSLAIMAATAARAMMFETNQSTSDNNINNSSNNNKRGSVSTTSGSASSTSNNNTSAAASTALTTAALIDAQTKLTVDNLMRVLKRCLPNKAEIAFVKLAKALSFDNQTGRYIDPDVVLYDDAQGNRPNFLEQLKLQHVTELMTFHKHVFDAIATFHDSEDKEMTVGKLREALVYADPQKPRAEVNKILAKACNSTVEEALLLEAKRTPLLIEDIKRRLRRCLLVKSPPQSGHKK